MKQAWILDLEKIEKRNLEIWVQFHPLPRQILAYFCKSTYMNCFEVCVKCFEICMNCFVLKNFNLKLKYRFQITLQCSRLDHTIVKYKFLDIKEIFSFALDNQAFFKFFKQYYRYVWQNLIYFQKWHEDP